MAEKPTLPRVDDPIAHLRRSVEGHRIVTQASIDAGRQLREQQPPQPTPEPENA